MGHRRLARESFREEEEKVKAAGGDTSFAGRQHQKETGKLHALVDPAGYGLIRKSWPRYVLNKSGKLSLEAGTPMLVENLFDTTSSMGGNVKLAFDSLIKQYDLLVNGTMPVLGRYDTQIINAIFGDIVDKHILARTQAEMDEKIAQQLTLMVAEKAGGDFPEDPEYGLFAAAFLTDTFINQYSLRSYHFMITDTTSHGRIDNSNLERVFGTTVYDTVIKNGYQLDKDDLPNPTQIVSELLKKAHAFAIILNENDSAPYWEQHYGENRVIRVRSTKYLHYVEAVIIGLTEGIFSLSEVVEYLESVNCDRSVAEDIQRSVANIPIGAQQLAENFSKIPAKGSVFETKRDLWPIENDSSSEDESDTDDTETWL